MKACRLTIRTGTGCVRLWSVLVYLLDRCFFFVLWLGRINLARPIQRDQPQIIRVNGPFSGPNSASSGDHRNRNWESVASEVIRHGPVEKSRRPGIFRDNLQTTPGALQFAPVAALCNVYRSCLALLLPQNMASSHHHLHHFACAG